MFKALKIWLELNIYENIVGFNLNVNANQFLANNSNEIAEISLTIQFLILIYKKKYL